MQQRVRTSTQRALALALLCGGVGCAGGKPGASADEGVTDLEHSGDEAMTIPAPSPEQFDAAAIPPGAARGDPDTTGGAWRVIEVPGLTDPSIVSSPKGWLALSRRSLGDGKAPSGWQSALYRSSDGVHWALVPLEPQNNDLWLTRIAYGAGRYVMTGQRHGDREGEVVWTSTDAEHWTERSLPPSHTTPWQELSYAHDRFFTFAFNQIGISETGKDWKTQPFSLIQLGAAAYGNGLYVVTGSGPIWSSEDGWAWHEHMLDCALPGACFGGTDHQGSHGAPVFAEGRFYSGELSSPDGEHWESTSGRSVAAYVGGHFLGGSSADPLTLSAWVSGGEVQTLRLIRPEGAPAADGRDALGVRFLPEDPAPANVDVSFEDGLSCETASCFLLGNLLLLAPPPGTPPL